MKNKSEKFLLLIVIVGCISPHAKSATLTEILAQYCVPKSEDGCSVGVKATYTNGICDCGDINKFYNSSERKCETCIQGSFASVDYKRCEPITCPEGYELVHITNGECPSGYELKYIKNGECDFAGYELIKYTKDGKVAE